jgi:hypothetical protein
MAIIGTLPNNIQDGQVADATPLMADLNFIVNQVNANATPIGSQPIGTLINIQTLTVTGVYTPTAGTSRVIVNLQGPGGGGAGAVATTSAQTSAAGGGGAGGFCSAFLASGFSGVTVTLPGGGAGGATGTGGTAPPAATFGAIMTANGGQGGAVAAGTPNSFGVGGAGGTAAGGTLNIQGAQGGLTDANQSFGLYHTVQGGNSIYGQGGIAVASGSNGANATGFGAGGGGTISAPSAAGVSGGAGSQSLCVIYEYT